MPGNSEGKCNGDKTGVEQEEEEDDEEEEERLWQSVDEIVKIIEEAWKGLDGKNNCGGLGLINGSMDLDDIDDVDIYDDVDVDDERNGDFVCALWFHIHVYMHMRRACIAVVSFFTDDCQRSQVRLYVAAVVLWL